MSIIQYIFKDLREPLSFIPAGAAIGIVICLLTNIGCHIYGRSREIPGAFTKDIPKTNPKPLPKTFTLLLFLLLLYVYILLQQSFFSRPPGSRTTITLELFSTWGKSAQSKAYVIENIIMFIPYGILLPLMITRMRRSGILCVCSAAVFSILLETAQYLTSRGFCQLDDVVMNTAGAFLGWLVVRIVLAARINRS